MLRLTLCVGLSILLHLAFVFVSDGGLSGSSGISNNFRAIDVIVRIVPLPTEKAEEVEVVKNFEPQTQTLKYSEGVIEHGTISSLADSSPALLLPNERYYTRSELTQGPYVVSAIDIGAPPTKLDIPWQIQIRIFVSVDGFADRVLVENSTAPTYIEVEAIAAFRSAKYAPGMLEGRAVKSQLLVEVAEK